MQAKLKTPKRRTPKQEADRVAAVEAGLGKFSWVPTSSEEFARRKANEIESEEQAHKKRTA